MGDLPKFNKVTVPMPERHSKIKTNDPVLGAKAENVEVNSPIEKVTVEDLPAKKVEEITKLNWHNYVPVKKLQFLLKHTIADGFAMICFWLLGMLANWLFPEDPIKTILHLIEYIGITLILVALLREVLREIIKDNDDGKDSKA